MYPVFGVYVFAELMLDESQNAVLYVAILNVWTINDWNRFPIRCIGSLYVNFPQR